MESLWESWLTVLILVVGVYNILELWVKHREKISDAIRENAELKKEIEALKSQKKSA